jgi:hypothetical protein
MLGIGSGSFDPETLVVLETAFDEAWITLSGSGDALFFSGCAGAMKLIAKGAINTGE